MLSDDTYPRDSQDIVSNIIDSTTYLINRYTGKLTGKAVI